MLKFAYPYQTPETLKPLLSASGPVDDVFRILKRMGYDAVELLIRDPKKLNITEIEASLNAVQLEVAAIGTGPMAADDRLAYTSEKDEIRQLAVKRTKEALEWAAHFNCPISIGKLRGQIYPESFAQSWERMKCSLEEILNHAEKLNVSLLMEPQNTHHMNNLTRTDETLAFISSFNTESLGIMLDTFHMYAEAGDLSFPDLFMKAEDHLRFIHLSDSDRLPPGEGFFDIKYILKLLESLEDCPYISLEIKQSDHSFEVANQSLQYLKSLLFNQ